MNYIFCGWINGLTRVWVIVKMKEKHEYMKRITKRSTEMEIRKCILEDVPQLALLNKQLIEDEKSNNSMNVKELEERMMGFLNTEYDAYFFFGEDSVVGYALVKKTCTPLYLRQFFIEREYRQKHYGTGAFHVLLEYLGVDRMDIEVLPWNERGMRFWESCGFKEISRYMRFEK